ncbi:hypothetical protein Rsub_10731 [Raphidocelis subcapitata]|uniref:Nucleoporin n=1 Tax=Raphidocelis subcapitata TaxID=307507 RepID=A0A2V0PKN1_9CHLO|nr:hypothetical protein Rsub_10731 [Raphidocelis subcapitata]|eukprot:GBF97595.1 hypothetical protein Rsub_10731 [Raphidocelis subcapitata]
MGTDDLRSLYWPGAFRGLYQQLQAADAATETRLRELLAARADWLLGGLPKFRPPGDDARSAARDAFKAGKLVLSSAAGGGGGGEKGGGQRVTLDAKLEDATLQLSAILDLNEVQTALLLRRFAADTGASPAAARGGAAGGQAALEAGRVVEVIEYYYSERLYLLKCLQFMAIAAEVDCGGVCADALGSLLRRGLALNVAAALTANLSAEGGGGAGGAALALAQAQAVGALIVAGAQGGAAAAAAPPPDLLSRRHLQLLHERCELLSLLARLYELHSSGLAAELASSGKENGGGGEKGGGGEEREGADADAAALFAPDRFSALLQPLHRAVLHPRAGRPAGEAGAAAELARLAECLAAVLVIAAMQPARQIELLSQRRLASSPLSAKGRSVGAELAGWGGSPGAAVVLLAWAAFGKLAATESGGIDELGHEEHLARAMASGGFSAFPALLSAPGLGPSTHAGLLCRRLLLQALCLVGGAFDLDPARLEGGVLRALVDAACAVLEAAEALHRRGVGRAHAGAQQGVGDGQPGIRSAGPGSDLFHCADLPWALAPEVLGTTLPAGSRGRALPMPPFLSPPAAAGGAAPERLLIQWEVQSDQGTGQVLLLARAAHCMRRLSDARGGGLGGEELEELSLILALMRALLDGSPLLARRLAGVSIPYTSAEAPLEWLSVFCAGADLLPSTADALLSSSASAGSAADAAAAATASAAAAAAARALRAAADCVGCAGALAAHQPARVASALARTRLLAALGPCGPVAAADEEAAPAAAPARVPVESLAATAAAAAAAAGAGAAPALDLRLPELQSLLRRLECPSGDYPVTLALLGLTAGLLEGHSTGGPVPALVAFALRDVLGRLGELPFSSPAARWRLAAAALRVARLAIPAGAAGAGGAAPKAPGPPAGVAISPLAASVVQQLAFAGHGYLSAALPPPCAALMSAAEQRGGDSAAGVGGGGGGGGDDEALAAALGALSELLALAPPLLGATAHFPFEVPLQQFWLSEPPTGGPSPAALLAGYAAYAYDSSISLAALEFTEALALALAPPCAPPGAARPPGAFSALLAAAPGLAGALVGALRAHRAAAAPAAFVRAAALVEAAARYHPDLLDALCFPCGLETQPSGGGGGGGADGGGKAGQDAAAAGALVPAGKGEAAAGAAAAAAGAGKKSPPPFSALDGLWALLRNAGALLRSSPRVAGAVMGALAALWECQASAHGAVELLRGQPGFWDALKACLPDPDSLPSEPPPEADPEESEAAAWRAAASACALHILLLERLASPADDGDGGDGARALAVALGPARLGALLAGAAAPWLPARLLESVLSVTQAAYLQLGSLGLRGAWGDAATDGLAAAPEARAEMAPLLAACGRGDYDRADLEAACRLLAAGAGGAAAAAASPAPSPAPRLPQPGARGGALAAALRREPLGRALLGRAAAGAAALAPAASEYGRSFLFDPNQIQALLGPFLFEEMATAGALAVLLGDLGSAASLSHARLALLQATASMVTSLPRDPSALKQLRAPGAADELLRCCVRAARAAAAEHERLLASPGSRLLICPWGLPVLGRASTEALLLCARTLLAGVRLWKGTHAAGGAAGGGGGGGGGAAPPAARPALLTRMGSSAASRSQGSRDAARSSASAAAAAAAALAAAGRGSGGGAGDAPELVAMAAAQAVATLLAGWLRGRAAEGSGPDAAGDEVTECLCTCLLLLLQEAPEAEGAVEEETGAAGGGGGGEGASVSRAELQLALLDVLPNLCSACAAAAAAAAATNGGAAERRAPAAAAATATHRAAVLQLLMEVLTRQLAPQQWLPHVGAHLSLVPMLRAAARGAGAGAGAGAAGQGAEVCAVSALEVLLAVARVPEGALQLFQQGALPAVLDAARDLLSPRGGGLLGAEAVAGGGEGGDGGGRAVPGTLGAYHYLGPATPGGAAGWAAGHQQWCVLLSLAAAAVRNLSCFVPVAEPAVALAVAAEPRLALSLQLFTQQLPPRGGGGGSGGAAAEAGAQLACLLEAERGLALLCLVAQHPGAWQLARPGAPAAFRAAAAGVLEFAARPSMERQLRVSCPPLTAFERRLSRVRSELAPGEGWLRVCAAGAGEGPSGGGGGGGGGSASAAGADAPAAGALALTPAASGGSDGGGGGDGGGGEGGGAAAGCCSEYVARLAEAVYSCADHALRFLSLTSPQIDPREVSEAGAMWPRRAALIALQDQAAALAQSQLSAAGGASQPRRRRLAAAALRIARGAAPFVAALGGRAGGAEERLGERLAQLERALGEAAGGGGAAAAGKR